MYLSQWKLRGPPIHQSQSACLEGPPVGSPLGNGGNGPQARAGHAATPPHQRLSSEAVCSADEDGDLDPPRRPGARKPGGSRALGGALSAEGPQLPSNGEGPTACIWVFQGKALDLDEVGRGLWSAAVSLGRFLRENPQYLWGGPVSGPSASRERRSGACGGPCSLHSKREAPPPASHEDSPHQVPLRAPRRVFRVLELGSGVGFLGPLLRRVLEGAYCRGASEGAPQHSVEIYLTDADTGALQLCSLTQRLNEVLTGGPFTGQHRGPHVAEDQTLRSSSGGVRAPLGPRAASCLTATEAQGPSAGGPCQGPTVSIRVRRLDWRQGGPWASALRKETAAGWPGPGAHVSEARGAPAAAAQQGAPHEAPEDDAFVWQAEETETLGAEGAVDLLLACDVLYDFALSERLAAFLKVVLKRNPNCRCLLAHTRRLGCVCATSTLPVDVFAEDFWDRFCDPVPQPDPDPQPDPGGGSSEAGGPIFEVYVHPKPATAGIVLSGVSLTSEADRVFRWLCGGDFSRVGGGPCWGPPEDANCEGPPTVAGAPWEAPSNEADSRFALHPADAEEATRLSEVVRAQAQELYAALFSGKAMKEALQWSDQLLPSACNDSWRTENRDEYRGHHWLTQQQQQQQQQQLLRGYLPSRGGLGKRRNEALLQRVGGGYQLYAPISWTSFRRIDAETNTPGRPADAAAYLMQGDRARHAATQTAAATTAASAAAEGTARGAAAAARGSPLVKPRESLGCSGRQRGGPACRASCNNEELWESGRGGPPRNKGAGFACCCCCPGSSGVEPALAAASPPEEPLPTIRPAAAAAAAAAGEGRPVLVLEPKAHIKAATASARHCHATLRRSRPQQLQQKQQQQWQQQGQQLSCCHCCCQEASRAPPCSYRAASVSSRPPLESHRSGGPQAVPLRGSGPSALQGHAGFLAAALRAAGGQQQQQPLHSSKDVTLPYGALTSNPQALQPDRAESDLLPRPHKPLSL
ncbi:hypothetical protein Efla_006356 [Eimeria flavescens]